MAVPNQDVIKCELIEGGEWRRVKPHILYKLYIDGEVALSLSNTLSATAYPIYAMEDKFKEVELRWLFAEER